MTRNNSTSYGTEDDRDPIKEVNSTIPDDTGITPRDIGSSPKEPTINGHNPITAVWQDIVEDTDILHHILLAARKAVTGMNYDEALNFVDTIGITDNPHMGHYPRRGICLLTSKPAVAKKSRWRLIRIVQELGTGASTVDEIQSMAGLFKFVYYNNPHIKSEIETPTLTIKIEYEQFKRLSRSQRADTCELLHILSKAFDIQLLTTQTTQAFLKHYHRKELPCVSEWSITPLRDTCTSEALVKLDPNGTSVSILDALADAPDGTVSYSELYEIIEKSDSRIRQCLKELREYSLVTSFGSPNNKKVSLVETGSEVLDNLQRRRQETSPRKENPESTPNSERHRREHSDSDSVCLGSEDNSSKINREGRWPVATGQHVTLPQQQPQLQQPHKKSNSGYQTGRMCPAMQDAVAACGNEQSTITIVDDEINHLDSSIQLFAFDAVRDTVIVSSHSTTPLDYSVGIAMALAHPKLINEALSEATLSTILEDTPLEILSRARQIGPVPLSEVEPDALQDALLEWRNEIGELTRCLKNGNYGTNKFDCRNDLLSEILRQAHGLAGCIVHLLDEAGVHVVRDIRIPSKLNSSKIKALAESIAHSITVQSQYKNFSAHRQLFESREGYRANSFTVEVDAADPFGNLIGSIVVRGGSATRIESDLTATLEAYDPVEDAPEFAIPIKIRDVTRDNILIATERVLERKNINPTQDAVSVLDAVVDSPFGVAKALHYLGTSSDRRDIKPRELRYALKQLSDGDLLSDLPRSVGQITEILLNATEPLTQTELADRADVSTQTIRNNESEIVSTGFVQYEQKPSGVKKWRTALSFDWEQNNSYPALESKDSSANSKPMEYEVLLGTSPKQTSILDESEFTGETENSTTPSENEQEDNSEEYLDDEEIDLDFSGISIPGSIDDCSEISFS